MNEFTQKVRAELFRNIPKKACCRRALLTGLLINAECGLDNTVYTRITGRDTAELAELLLTEQYGKKPAAVYSCCYGRTVAEISVESDKLKQLLFVLSDPDSAVTGFPFIKCAGCGNNFISGILLSCSRISLPDHSSRLELRINDSETAAKVAAYFNRLGHPPVISERDGDTALIFKRADSVEFVLGYAGAQKSTMDHVQFKMIRELRASVNRKSNCDIENLERTIVTARSQLDAINRLRLSGHFESLPEELRESALVREREPELALSELALKHNPPISKSGLNHRLRKIVAAAERLDGSQPVKNKVKQ